MSTTTAVLAEDVDELEVLAGVATWAAIFLRGEAPVFGSPAWLALPLEDPRRTRAVVRAALAWWRCGAPTEDLEDRARAALDVLSAHGVCAQQQWGDLSYSPTAAELDRRRDWTRRAAEPATRAVSSA